MQGNTVNEGEHVRRTASQTDSSHLAREFLDSVRSNPGCIGDLGVVKIVPLCRETIVLCGSRRPDQPRALTREEIITAIPAFNPVCIVEDGFNIDYTIQALRQQKYERCDPVEAVERISRRFAVTSAMRTSEGVLAHRAAADGHMFVYGSDAMRDIDYEISRIAGFDFDVLLTGETGVGKDAVATEIHRRSQRAKKKLVFVPLRSLNPSLIESELFGHVRGAFSGANNSKPGKFEAAEGGTVYIPEISNIGEEMQLKLLYFMQYKRCLRVGENPHNGERLCNVRLIMASNDDLDTLIRQGKLREDFYYRIKGLSLDIPPLRERPKDIPVLVHHFLSLYGHGRAFSVTSNAMRVLQRYHWPGNIRELENAVKSVIPFIHGNELSEEQLSRFRCIAPQEDRIGKLIRDMHELPEYAVLEKVIRTSYFRTLLERNNGVISIAAQRAGMTSQGLRKALCSLGIEH